MKSEKTECSETSSYKIQTPENHPKESIQHSRHGESLKSRSLLFFNNIKRLALTGEMQCASLDVQAEEEFLNFRLFVQLNTFYFKLRRRKKSSIFN